MLFPKNTQVVTRRHQAAQRARPGQHLAMACMTSAGAHSPLGNIAGEDGAQKKNYGGDIQRSKVCSDFLSAGLLEECCHAPDKFSGFSNQPESAAAVGTHGRGQCPGRRVSSNTGQWPSATMPDATRIRATSPRAARLLNARSRGDQFVRSTGEEWKVWVRTVQVDPPFKRSEKVHLFSSKRASKGHFVPSPFQWSRSGKRCR